MKQLLDSPENKALCEEETMAVRSQLSANRFV